MFILWDKSETMQDRSLSIFQQRRRCARAGPESHHDAGDEMTLILRTCTGRAERGCGFAAEPSEGDQRGWMEREAEREFNQIATQFWPTRKTLYERRVPAGGG